MRGLVKRLCAKNSMAKRIVSMALVVLMMTTTLQALPAGCLAVHASNSETVANDNVGENQTENLPVDLSDEKEFLVRDTGSEDTSAPSEQTNTTTEEESKEEPEEESKEEPEEESKEESKEEPMAEPIVEPEDKLEDKTSYTVTLHCYDAQNWGSMAIWIWDNDENYTGGNWPGTNLADKAVEGKDGWYDITISDVDEDVLNIILNNNGAGSQTADLSVDLSKIKGDTKEVWVSSNGSVYVEAPSEWTNGTSDDIAKKLLTVHFYNEKDWKAVAAYVYDNNGNSPKVWPGTVGTKDKANNAEDKWYTVKITDIEADAVKLIMNNNGNGSQDADIPVELKKDSTEIWVMDGVASLSKPNALKSPVVDGNQVTFYYEDTSEDGVDTVYLRGTLCGWGDEEKVAFSKHEGNVFSHTMTVTPGVYKYKFYNAEFQNGGWIADPLNKEETDGDGNSILIVPGMYDLVQEVQLGEDATLPEALTYLTENETETTKKVTYRVKDEEDASYITINGNAIKVSDTYKKPAMTLVATAVEDDTITAEVTLKFVEDFYTYTVYAYSPVEERNAMDKAAVYVWDKAGETTLEAGDYAFTSTEVLRDGRTWLKAEINLACSNQIGFIFKRKGDWGWQTSDLVFANVEKTDKTIYLVDGFNKVYTSLDEIPKISYVYIDYKDSVSSNDSYVEAWGNGYSYKDDGALKNLNYAINHVNGKNIAKIPVAMGDADKEISFIIHNGGNDTDTFTVTVPADKNFTKVKFANGAITNIVPYSVGFEADRENKEISFYYRDEELYEANNMGTLADTEVKLVLRTKVGSEEVSDVTEYPMTYSDENERFEVTELTLEDNSDYYYYYMVGQDKKLDIHNERTTTLDGEEYSLCRNKSYDITLSADVAYDSMDYDDNNVISLSWTGSDVDGFHAEKIYVDLSPLGLSNKAEMDLELNKLSFGCLEGTSTGTKTLKVTLIDDCDMSYTTTVNVTVKERKKTTNTSSKLGTFDWDEAVIYFAITDRFFDGNKSNNTGKPYNPADKGSYHGGDFAGLTQKMDYLYDLGVNTIWLTPIVDNIDINLDPDEADPDSYAYHGYWASDFTKLNPHLGTEAEFKALVDAAHAKGMKIMVDVVLNHPGYETTNDFIDMVRDASNTIPGDLQKDGLSGLPDFVTENPEVREQLIEWQTGWMKEYEIDYYRVDTVKHVENTTWSAFKNALIEQNQDFKLIGEYYDAGYLNNFGQLDTGRMDSVLDFNFNDLMLKLVSEDLAGIENALCSRNTGLTNTATVGSFNSSHDEPGLLYTMKGSKGDWANSLMKVAATYQITAKGQPVIYYGEEIGLSGANNYPYQDNRYDFDWDAQKKQAKETGSMYNHYKTLLNIRRDYSEIFAKGNRVQIVPDSGEGYEVFSRSHKGNTLYVGVNVWGDARETKLFVPGEEGTVYKDLYNDKEYTVEADGSITITIPGAADGGTAILEGSDVTVKDTNKITVKLHYTRNDGNYTGWNAWMWADAIGGKQYDFVEENGEMVATMKDIPGRTTNRIGYLTRKGDWVDRDYYSDQWIDISDIVSGTVHYYINASAMGGTRVLGSDAIIGNKIISTEYNHKTNKVVVNMSMPITGSVLDAFTIECTTNNTVIGISSVEKDGNTYYLTLAEDISSLEALLRSYTITFDGYAYSLMTPNVYSSKEFEEAYTYDGDDLGLTYTKSASTFKLWAPTADAVELNVYECGTKGTDDKLNTYTMVKGEKGVWSYTLKGDWDGKYYTYSVNVNNEVNEACDPYARTTGVNGNRAMILDLDSTDPAGWGSDTGAHAGMDYTDAVIYELHVRDLSSDSSSGVSEANRGKFLGLTETGTKTAGGQPTALDHMIDLGITHLHLIPVYDYGSVDETKLDTPQFNWGYDPVNYNVPEGSYSTNPYDGASRVSEMKQMVKTLHDNNINVVMDVVYNHVYDAETFAFNQVVPKYFSRTNADGTYSNGSGCGNDTASERSMVHKYIVDSILYWHDEYHIDGFRFDLVGLIDTVTINKIVEEVHAIDPDILFYGEGWTMNTTVTKDNYNMATQWNSSLTPEFAYFSDNIRNGIAGSDINGQGLIWGTGDLESMKNNFMANPGWTKNPTQTVNYVSCHDNYTLMDKINVVSDANVTKYSQIPGEYQVKQNNLVAAYYMFSQGIPFIHAGEDFLRMKLNEEGTVIHNSYNSSDYVNKLRWSNLDTAIYADTVDYYEGLIEFRKNHAALRLTTASEVTDNVTAYTVKDDVLLYKINGKVNGEVADGIIIVYNASGNDCEVTLSEYGVSGDWSVCVNAEDAGTDVLETVAQAGSVTVEAHSAMALVKGETVDTDSVYAKNNKVSVSLNKTEMEANVGGAVAMKATVKPANSTVTWESSDASVATVDANGKVTAVAEGTATITVTTLHGVKATCEVTVTTASNPSKPGSSNKPSSSGSSSTPSTSSKPSTQGTPNSSSVTTEKPAETVEIQTEPVPQAVMPPVTEQVPSNKPSAVTSNKVNKPALKVETEDTEIVGEVETTVEDEVEIETEVVETEVATEETQETTTADISEAETELSEIDFTEAPLSDGTAEDDNTAILWIISIVSILLAAACAIYFVQKKKREN